MVSDLLSCPFCGTAAERDPVYGGYVKCPSAKCPIGSPVNDSETLWFSEFAWQTRAGNHASEARQALTGEAGR